MGRALGEGGGTFDGAAMEGLLEQVALYSLRRRKVGHMHIWRREWLECRSVEGE